MKQTTNRVIDAPSKIKAIKGMFSHPEELGEVTAEYGGFDVDHTIKCYTIFQTEDITITWAKLTKKDKVYPDHSHKDSIEYLIAFKGSFKIKFGDCVRFLRKGECVSVPQNVNHLNIALEDNSEMLGICIPPEKAYLKEEYL